MVEMVGERGGKRKTLVLLVLAAVTLLSSPLALADDEKPGDTKIAEEDGEEVCKWEDAEGEAKCRELAKESLDDSDEAEPEEDEEEPEEDEWNFEYGDEDEDEDEDEYFDYEHQAYQELKESYRDEPEEGEEYDIWKHGGKMAIYEELECPDFDYDDKEMFKDTSFEKIHSNEAWKTFNKVYNEVIAAVKDDEKLKQEPTIPPEYEKHGFQFPIEIQFRPVMGRGVYATTDIPEGSLLYISTNNAAFLNGQTFRDFLKALPKKLACDVLIWSFVRWVSLETEENNEHMVCVDLDEGSFVNSADDEESYNMALGNDAGELVFNLVGEDQFELWYGCKMKFYSVRDIKAGEEILASYGDFAEVDGWMYMGL